MDSHLVSTTIAIGSDFFTSVQRKSVCKDMMRIYVWRWSPSCKGFWCSAKEGWIDGGFGFDKGRMLWLPPPPPQLCLVFARRTSLLIAIRSGHNSISPFSNILGNTLATTVFLHIFVWDTFPTHCLSSAWFQSNLIENSQLVAEHGIPAITMVLLWGSVGWPGHFDFLQDEG